MDENVTNTEETVHEKENEQTGKTAGSCLPLAADQLDLAKQYKQMMLIYEAGIRQLTTKLQILNRAFMPADITTIITHHARTVIIT